LGVFVTRFAEGFLTRAMPAGSVAIPLAATAVLAFLTACAIAFAVPSGTGPDRPVEDTGDAVVTDARPVPKLLILAFIVSACIGVFEVGLALRG
ncbi:hypothetical protein ABTH15_19325, partial [Acinetobacter baumannii]